MPNDCYELILNHNCDLACGFCSQSDFDPKIKSGIRDAVRRIYTAKKLGYRRLGFSGGEALLRADLPFLAATARKVGFKIVRLQTNGFRLADPALCRRLAAAGLTVCKFTFPGHSAPVHDRLTGVAGSFKKSLRGLDNMLALKLAVGVNIPVMKQNYKGLKAALRFFMDRGATNFTLIYPIYAGSMKTNFRRLGVGMPEAAGSIVGALDFARAAGLGVRDIKALNMPPCLLNGHEDNAVDLYKFNTTVASPLGLELDLDSNVAADKAAGPVCAACLFRRRCPGVDRHYLELFGWKGFRPVLKRAKLKQIKPEPGYLNGLEKCFMEVLKKQNNIPTTRVLALAMRLPLCHDCRDGSSVLATGETLIKKGLVKRDFKNGKYFWRLIPDSTAGVQDK
ncbi:MAG: radical SAM protein [Elusimicrobia bacterium]|nr:radical SAM protein [Elusimicrobiota bacterium]